MKKLIKSKQAPTCPAHSESVPWSSDLASVSVDLAYADLEGGLWDVVVVEQNMHQVHAILTGDEPHGILAWKGDWQNIKITIRAVQKRNGNK